MNTAVAYKLVMPPDGSYSVYINNAVVASGSLANDFTNNGSYPTGSDFFKHSGIDVIAFWFKQIQAGSIFDDILLSAS